MIFLSIFTAAGSLNQIVQLLITQMLPASVVIKLFLLSLPRFLHLILPMSVLLATLLGLSRISSQYEVLALKASGVSLFSIFYPVLIFACFVSMASFVLQETIVPWTQLSYDRMIARLARGGKEMETERKSIFLKTLDEDGRTLKRVFYAERYDLSKKELLKVWDLEFVHGLVAENIIAKKAQWKEHSWEFHEGKINRFNDQGQLQQIISFEKHVIRMNETPQEILRQQEDPDNMTLKELLAHIQFARKFQRDIPLTDYLVQMHVHFAIPLTAILFAIIGTALGITTKPYGSFLGIGLSALIIFGYHMVSSYTLYMGKAGYLSPAFSVWLSYGFFALIGVVLLLKKAG